LPFGVLALGVGSRRSQPTVFVKARYVRPALIAVRNRRRVNLVLNLVAIVKPQKAKFAEFLFHALR